MTLDFGAHLRKFVFDVAQPGDLSQKVASALEVHLNRTSDAQDADIAKWREHVVVGSLTTAEDIAHGCIKLSVVVRPPRPVNTISFDFVLEARPPEPTIVDRMAALEDREAAWRCFEYDRWTEEQARVSQPS